MIPFNPSSSYQVDIPTLQIRKLRFKKLLVSNQTVNFLIQMIGFIPVQVFIHCVWMLESLIV